MKLLQRGVIFPTTPDVCCCTTLETQKFEFVANLEGNANNI